MVTSFLLKFLWENHAIAPSRSRSLVFDQGRAGHILRIFIQPAIRVQTCFYHSLLPLATVAAIDSLRAPELSCSGDLLLPRKVPPMLRMLLYRVGSDQGSTVDPFELSCCTCVCLTSCLVLLLKLVLALFIWVKRERDGVWRGSSWIRPNLLCATGYPGWPELESCLKGLDLVFHFLLRLCLLVPHGLWVQLELIAQTVSNIGILAHLHVNYGQLIFLHGSQFLLIRTFGFLLSHNETVGFIEVIECSASLYLFLKLWLSSNDKIPQLFLISALFDFLHCAWVRCVHEIKLNRCWQRLRGALGFVYSPLTGDIFL